MTDKMSKLCRSIKTESYDLELCSRIRAWQILKRSVDDPEINYQLNATKSSQSSYSLWRMTRKLTKKHHYFHAIVDRSTKTLAGSHNTTIFGYKSAILGVTINNKNYWGTGLVQEVRKASIVHFARHFDVQQFVGTVNARNFASIANYQQLGFEHVGTDYSILYDTIRKEPVDQLKFSLRGDALLEAVSKWEK